MADADTLRPDWLLQMESILETLNEGVVILDDSLLLVSVNDVPLDWGGYQRQDVLGRTAISVFPAEHLPYVYQQRAKAERYGYHCHEFYFPGKDGEKVPAIISGRMNAGPDGRQYSVLTVINISEQTVKTGSANHQRGACPR